MKIKERDLEIWRHIVDRESSIEELSKQYKISESRIRQIVNNVIMIKTIQDKCEVANLDISYSLFNFIGRKNPNMHNIDYLLDQANKDYPDCSMSYKTKCKLNIALINAGYDIKYINDFINVMITDIIINKAERIVKFIIKDCRGVLIFNINRNQYENCDFYFNKLSCIPDELIKNAVITQLNDFGYKIEK